MVFVGIILRKKVQNRNIIKKGGKHTLMMIKILEVSEKWLILIIIV